MNRFSALAFQTVTQLGVAHKLQLGFDFGARNTRVVLGKKLIFSEASLLVTKKSGELVALGDEALQLSQSLSSDFLLIKPVIDGRVTSQADLSLFLQAIKIKLASELKLKSFVNFCQASIALPVKPNPLQQQVLVQAMTESFVFNQNNFYGPGELLALANQNSSSYGILHLGEELGLVALAAHGQVFNEREFFWGGKQLKALLEKFLLKQKQASVSALTLEMIIRELISFKIKNQQNLKVIIRAKNLLTNLPCTIELSGEELLPVLDNWIKEIEWNIKLLLDKLSSNQLDGLLDEGVILTGGLANIRGLAAYLSQEFKLPFKVSGRAELAIARGLKQLHEKQ